ncbi:MAG: AMP-binding protein [bacterium]
MKTPRQTYPHYPVEPISTLAGMLTLSADKHADRLALQDLNATPIPRVTYRQLYDNVIAFGTALRILGLKERDHVAFIAENRVQWAITHLACVTFNFVAVPIDKNLKENDIVNILHVSDSKAAVFSAPFRYMFLEFKQSVKHLHHLIDMDLPAKEDGIHSMTEMMKDTRVSGKQLPMPSTNPDDVAVIVFTSGSMGHAKGVTMTQTNLCTNLMDMRKMINIGPDDRFLSVLPMHHTCTREHADFFVRCMVALPCSMHAASNLSSTICKRQARPYSSACL